MGTDESDNLSIQNRMRFCVVCSAKPSQNKRFNPFAADVLSLSSG